MSCAVHDKASVAFWSMRIAPRNTWKKALQVGSMSATASPRAIPASVRPCATSWKTIAITSGITPNAAYLATAVLAPAMASAMTATRRWGPRRRSPECR